MLDFGITTDVDILIVNEQLTDKPNLVCKEHDKLPKRIGNEL